MPTRLSLIAPCTEFWPAAAREVLKAHPQDWGSLRIVVPAAIHGQSLKHALAQEMSGAFIAPRIHTLKNWLSLQAPPAMPTATPSQRLMGLYAELRQHAWLKNLFGASRNTDLMPLAQLLLALCDELTEAMLPTVGSSTEAARERWQAALEQLSPPARSLLSNEAQLVWSVWQSQLAGNALAQDPVAARFAQMMHLAAQASEPLVWIDAVPPGPMERAFLEAYGQRQPVMQILLDWSPSVIAPVFARAWPELAEGAPATPDATDKVKAPQGLSICTAADLEQEAWQGAQLVVDWLQEGKACVAVVAQDRLAARRMRALLERAGVVVTDETGWKLSTTRAAAALAAWFEAVATRGDTIALLDFLKSPFAYADMQDKAGKVMAIEAALRRQNVLGGWDTLRHALNELPEERKWIDRIGRQATSFSGKRSLAQWIAGTHAAFGALGMAAALALDPAGLQVLRLLEGLQEECGAMAPEFSFAEWRAFLSQQMEATTFSPSDADRRVVMLSLQGARLRKFEAVLVVGCDAEHLPSQNMETLFFANAVRRELGLITRELHQRTQLRDFAEVICSNPQVVLSWQEHKNGEPNPPSVWIERLRLVLQAGAAGPLPKREVRLASTRLAPQPVARPLPSAPQLLPQRLSASAYNSFVACPYQFFVTRMLRLASLDELSDQPEKRDYGGWLHEILHAYHQATADSQVEDREGLLRRISEEVFGRELDKSASALGYYARWQKVIPAYLEWANEREAAGWRFVLGEHWLERTLPLERGQIVLHGRVDRIDENTDGDWAVLDYKTQTQTALAAKLKDGEDQQLMFYGLLSERTVGSAGFVALETTRERQGHKAGAVEAKDYAQQRAGLERHIVASMNAIAAGAALHPNGVEAVCRYCEVRGICRKGYWL